MSLALAHDGLRQTLLTEISNMDASEQDRGPKIEIELLKDEPVREMLGDCPDITIDDAVREQIHRYAVTDTKKELAGVLLGHVRGSENGTVVSVCAAIEARYTEAVYTSVKFTHASWDYITKVKDEMYPELRIVGWFHTHPGFGIFLSSWDLFIQEHFFNLPWQIAYVVDPVAQTSGFFRWERGSIVEVCQGTAWAPRDDSAGNRSQPTAGARLRGHEGSDGSVTRRFVYGLLIGSCLAGVALGYIGALYTKSAIREDWQTMQRPTHTRKPPDVGHPSPGRSSLQHQQGATAVTGKTYEVQPGDVLYNIAKRTYGDAKYADAIARKNHVSRPENLQPGDRLVLPSREEADRILAGL